MAKVQHLNLKAPSNNVQKQLDETLTTQTYVSVTTKQMGFYIKEIRQQVDKRTNNEAKFKNQPKFFKPNIFKRLKNH